MGDYSKIKKKIFPNKIIKKPNLQSRLSFLQNSGIDANFDDDDYVKNINNHHIELQTKIESKIKELKVQLLAAQAQVAIAQARIDAAHAETAAAQARAAVDNSTYVDVIQENLVLRRKITELTRIVNEHESAVNRILDP
jgi:hypothetical protein